MDTSPAADVPAGRAELALAIIGSNTTAIGAETVAATMGYRKVSAIVRRGTPTVLPVAMNGEDWAARLKRLGLFGNREIIAAFLAEISGLTGGESFDCLLHHSTDPFSQLLSDHPLCRNFYYVEEGFTALIGGQFGRAKKRKLKRGMWSLKSRLFFGGRIDRYRDFFDIRSPRYGGCYAISKGAFKGFPGRIQLDIRDSGTGIPSPARVLVFLDSQYLIGNCTEEQYAGALGSCLRSVAPDAGSVAIKFHPAERDPVRKSRMIDVIRQATNSGKITELPGTFVGERLVPDDDTKVVVGTTALGLYLGDRGFETWSFAPRIAVESSRFDGVMKGIPAEFWDVCRRG